MKYLVRMVAIIVVLSAPPPLYSQTIQVPSEGYEQVVDAMSAASAGWTIEIVAT